jgi:baculoviral IAP repeat-containing protein 6
MLSEEMFKIKSLRAPRLNAEAEGDDVHVWRVRLGCFTAATPLGADLAALGARFPGCGAELLELRLRFKADLFPFFPPQVDVVRPRLRGVARGALVAHPALRVANWDPFTTCTALVERLRAFLEAHARVDGECAANDPRAHPLGAHEDDLSQLDGALAQLGALASLTPPAYAALYEAHDAGGGAAGGGASGSGASGSGSGSGAAAATLAPRAPAKPSSSVADMEAEGGEEEAAASDAEGGAGGGGLPGSEEEEEEEGDEDEEEDDEDGGGAGAGGAAGGGGGGGGTRKRKAGTFWAKGTGYGHDGAGGGSEERWDPAKTAAAQAAQDEATQRIALGCTALLGRLCAAPAPATALATEVVRRSALAPFLELELRGLSIMDVGARSAYYAALMHLIVAVGATPAADAFAGAAAQLSHIEAQARMFLRLSASVLADGAAGSEGGGATAGGGNILAPGATPLTAEDDFALARLVIHAADTLRAGLGATAHSEPVQAAAEAAAAVEAEATKAAAAAAAAAAATAAAARGAPGGRATRRGAAAAAAAAAVAASAPAAAAAAPGLPADGGAAGASAAAGGGGGGDGGDGDTRAYAAALGSLALDCCTLSGEHTFRGDSAGDPPAAKQVRRVAKESAGLAALLPLTPSSSVFVRVDERSTSLWRALITGPEGTPYAGGCFIFDFFFPSAYPAVPPKVILLTTGGGTVRFNPNLYNCGKVCLSLLGTWHGGKGEGWDPAVSSALQVLVSIQSLIFVPQPVFNEPGHERQMGSPEGDEMNRAYNAPIREATIRYAMLEPLRRPRAEFAEVVRRHFRTRRGAILAECGAWVRQARGGERASLESYVAQLTAELDKLGPA